MSGATRAGSTRLVLSGRGVRRTFALVLVGRLAYGLLPLPLLFTIRDASGSFAVAATASAALGFATFAMPLQTRLVDRHGQRRVVPWYAGAYVALLLLTAALSTGRPPGGVWIVLAVALGLSAPALGPAMRAQWREIAPEGPARRAAYSLDSVGEESLYLAGPLLGSAVIALAPARTGVVLAAGLVVIGVLGLVVSPWVPTAGGPEAERPRGGVLRTPGFARLLATVLLTGTGASCAFIGIAALADGVGRPSAAGLVEAAMALGAIGAGLAWARMRADPAWRTALTALLLLIAAAQAAAGLLAPSLLLVGAALVVCGAAAAPVFVVAYTAADALVEAERRTEASTWVNTASNGGSSIGTALAGLLVAGGAGAPFLAAAGATVAAVLVLGLRRRQPR